MTQVGDQELTAGFGVVPGSPVVGGRFGAALATADFDGDGFVDLAIGAPAGEPWPGRAVRRVPSLCSTGPGTGCGFASARRGWHPGHLRRAGERLRPATVSAPRWRVGDFDGDGRADLAIGAAGRQRRAGRLGAGAVNVLCGRAGGLSAEGARLWTQDTPGIKGLAGTHHAYGAALAAGDMSGDGRDDLAIGIPGGYIGSQAGRGRRVGPLRPRRWPQRRSMTSGLRTPAGIKGVAASNDNFGRGLAIGDLDGDGASDLAIGVTGRDGRQ